MKTADRGPWPELDTLVRDHLEGQYFRGAAIRVRHRGQVGEAVWGHGVYEGQRQEVLTPDQLFDLASLSKLFTTVALLRLITLKELDESTRVGDRLKTSLSEVRALYGATNLVALMTHSSGLRPWFPFYTRCQAPFEDTLAYVLATYPLEMGMAYSDLNYMILGKVIEASLQLPLDRAMDELVFKPLGLKTSTYRPGVEQSVATEFGNAIEERMCGDLGLVFDGWRPKDRAIRGACDDGNCHYYFNGIAGHAGIFSTGEDLETLGRVFLGDFPGFIAPDLLSRATRDRGSTRGYGVQFGELYPRGGFGHTGFTGTYLYMNTEKDLIITTLTNRLHVPVPKDLKSFRRAVVETVLESLGASGRPRLKS